MEYICKKTNELTAEELSQITALFNEVFEKQATTDFMLSQYRNNPFGYSYHSLAVDNGQVVGHSSYVPAWFWYYGQKVVFVCGGDTMIRKGYRDGFVFYDVIKNAHKYLKENSVVMNYGYPNDSSCPVLLKARLTKYIGKMHTYCLPYKIGGIKRNLSWLNWLSETVCWLWVGICGVLASPKVATYPIHKDDDSYNPSRYRRFNADYQTFEWGGQFRIKEHEGVRTAFIIDLPEKSPRRFVSAVRYLLNHHSKEFDLILYAGELPFAVTGLMRLPRKAEPKNFNMTGNILDKSVLDPLEIYNISHWDTNFSNYDIV